MKKVLDRQIDLWLYYSQNVTNNSYTPHIWGKAHCAVVKHFWSHKLRSAPLYKKLLSRKISIEEENVIQKSPNYKSRQYDSLILCFCTCVALHISIKNFLLFLLLSFRRVCLMQAILLRAVLRSPLKKSSTWNCLQNNVYVSQLLNCVEQNEAAMYAPHHLRHSGLNWGDIWSLNIISLPPLTFAPIQNQWFWCDELIYPNREYSLAEKDQFINKKDIHKNSKTTHEKYLFINKFRSQAISVI